MSDSATVFDSASLRDRFQLPALHGTYRICIRTLQILVCSYLILVVFGLIPVNNDFAPAPDGIEIFVSSNPVHADVIIPLVSDVYDWRREFSERCFSGETSHASHAAIGWGDRGFFLNTPRWSDLTVGTASQAMLWPSETCLHVRMLSNIRRGDSTRSVRITEQQYRKLIEFISSSFRRDRQGRPIQIAGASYQSNDAFFEAVGTYHAANTCNSWVGRALKAAGVRVGWFTPLPKTVFLYLPQQ